MFFEEKYSILNMYVIYNTLRGRTKSYYANKIDRKNTQIIVVDIVKILMTEMSVDCHDLFNTIVFFL